MEEFMKLYLHFFENGKKLKHNSISRKFILKLAEIQGEINHDFKNLRKTNALPITVRSVTNNTFSSDKYL